MRKRSFLPCRLSLIGLAVANAFISSTAVAEVPYDIGGLSVWLDASDIDALTMNNETDLGVLTRNAFGLSRDGASYHTWRSKVSDSDAAKIPDGKSFTYSEANKGITFDGKKRLALFSTFNVGTSPEIDVFIVANADSSGRETYFFWAGPDAPVANADSFLALSAKSDSNKITLYTKNGSNSKTIDSNLSTNLAGRVGVFHLRNNVKYPFVYVRDELSMGGASTNTDYAQYIPASDHKIYIGGGYSLGPWESKTNNTTDINSADIYGYVSGVVSNIREVLIFNKMLNATEISSLISYFKAKYPDINENTLVDPDYKYYIGLYSSAIPRATSKGLAITGNAGYMMLRKKSLMGFDKVESNLPPKHSSRSGDVWKIDRLDTLNSVNTKFWFNLNVLSIPGVAGNNVTLLYSSTDPEPASGEPPVMQVIGTAALTADNTVEFSVSSPQSGFYALGFPTPSVTLTSIAKGIGAEQVAKTVPGSLFRHIVSVKNESIGTADNNSIVVALPIPDTTRLYVGDIDATGGGPVKFVDGNLSSGLSYTFTALDSTTDNLEFSKDGGITWDYTPVPAEDKTDAAVNSIRVKFGGTLAGGNSPDIPNFELSYGLVVK